MVAPVALPPQLGRNRILNPLGAGGMGAVYLAEDTLLSRKVALKVPHSTPDEEGHFLYDRFGSRCLALESLPRGTQVGFFRRKRKQIKEIQHRGACANIAG